MKVYVAHDGALRVRIGHETPGSESLGPWYGGTGAVRLRQVADAWFWAYRLDDHADRGTAKLPRDEFESSDAIGGGVAGRITRSTVSGA